MSQNFVVRRREIRAATQALQDFQATQGKLNCRQRRMIQPADLSGEKKRAAKLDKLEVLEVLK